MQQRTFPLASGEAKTGIDIELRGDGVEITGVVSDVTGGPVGHALVTENTDWWESDLRPLVETDDQGHFSMWVKPGDVHVSASADGYAPGSDDGQAPGSFQILLTPESSLAGTVVDAKSGEPVPGVLVSVAPGEWDWGGDGDNSDVSDEHGAFRVSRLAPGRYKAHASSAHGYGVSAGSTLVGLGQHVEGVVVKLHPAYQVAGEVQLPDKTRCKQPNVTLNDKKTNKYFGAIREPDNTLHVDGILPGTYSVDAGCSGYQSKDKYDDIVITDKDLDKQVWLVEAGATIKGMVRTKAGAPVEDANIYARTVGGAARSKTGWGNDTSARDGTYAIKGLKAGTFKLEISSEVGKGPLDGEKVDIAAGATLQKDFVLEDGGSIKGMVVDDKGAPVTGVHVRASSLTKGWEWGGSDVRTKPDGSFTLDNLRPGDYRVTAQRGVWSDDLRKPGSTDDAKQGEKVAVTVAKPASVRLVVESLSGVIKGTVSDPNGAPVSDAYVTAARESDAAGARGSSVAETRWSFDEKPVLSGTDGAFAVTRLSPGKYTIRAYRKGGGEAVVEHVALGSTAKLVIKATGSITGVAHREGKQVQELRVEVVDAKTGFHRNESFFRTGGAFELHDLPAGNFTLTASAEDGKKQLTVDLTDGQNKEGLDIVLDELVKLTGRIVDAQTKAPVPGFKVNAALAKSRGNFIFGETDDESVTDEQGRFTVVDAPRGKITLTGFPKDFMEGDYGFMSIPREITGSGTVDVGDLPVLKKRLKENQTAGELGIHFAEAPPDTEPEQHQFKVSFIDPAGPAAKLDIKVGDVVTTIDGMSVAGVDYANGYTLMRAPVGTKLVLGLARGTTVTVVLAAP